MGDKNNQTLFAKKNIREVSSFIKAFFFPKPNFSGRWAKFLYGSVLPPSLSFHTPKTMLYHSGELQVTFKVISKSLKEIYKIGGGGK